MKATAASLAKVIHSGRRWIGRESAIYRGNYCERGESSSCNAAGRLCGRCWTKNIIEAITPGGTGVKTMDAQPPNNTLRNPRRSANALQATSRHGIAPAGFIQLLSRPQQGPTDLRSALPLVPSDLRLHMVTRPRRVYSMILSSLVDDDKRPFAYSEIPRPLSSGGGVILLWYLLASMSWCTASGHVR